MKKIILTGASGFIGRHAVSELLKKNYEIHAIYHNNQNIEDKHVTYHKVDLFDYSQQESLISELKPSHLLHFAWYTVPGNYWSSLENFKWVQASLELLELFHKYGGQRAVVAGTCAEYDWSFGYCSEGITPTRPSTLYGTCKNSLQEMMAQFSKQTGLSYAWGRNFYMYGPFENPSRLIPFAINSLLLDKQANFTHGKQVRDYLYVQDVANAFVALLNSEVQGPVNIASGQPVALGQIIYNIADKLDKRHLVNLGVVRAPEDEPPFLLANVRRLSQEVGWTPKYSLDDGLKRTIEWWRQHLEK